MMRGYGYGPNTMMGGSAWGGILLVLFALLILTGLVLLVIWLIRQQPKYHHMTGPQQPGMPQHPPTRVDGHHEAVAIAKKRLASGEINKEQYDEIMTTLGP